MIAQQENYQKSGFKFFYNNIRFNGRIKGTPGKNIVSLKSIPFQALLAFDSEIYGVNRASFLQHWITMPNAYALGKIENNQLLGYGVIRKCSKGYKIGPLFAGNFDVAKELFLSLADCCDSSDLLIDIPESHSAAKELTRLFHLEEVFRTARMYKGIPLKQDLSSTFGITSFELG